MCPQRARSKGACPGANWLHAHTARAHLGTGVHTGALLPGSWSRLSSHQARLGLPAASLRVPSTAPLWAPQGKHRACGVG